MILHKANNYVCYTTDNNQEVLPFINKNGNFIEKNTDIYYVKNSNISNILEILRSTEEERKVFNKIDSIVIFKAMVENFSLKVGKGLSVISTHNRVILLSSCGAYNVPLIEKDKYTIVYSYNADYLKKLHSHHRKVINEVYALLLWYLEGVEYQHANHKIFRKASYSYDYSLQSLFQHTRDNFEYYNKDKVDRAEKITRDYYHD